MRLFLCALTLAMLAGCVTNDRGEKKFNPWKAAQKTEQQFDEWWYTQ